VHALYFASWAAHIPHIRAALSLPVSTLGLILLAAPAGLVIASFSAVRVIPRWGSRRVVRAALVGYCVSGIAVGLAHSSASLFAALLLWGAFQATLDMAMNTQAGLLELVEHRSLMPGFHGFWSLGTFTGAAVGTLAVTLHISLATQMMALSIPVLAAILPLSRWMLEDIAPQPDAPGRDVRGRSVWSRPVLALAGIAFAALLCEGAAADWSAVYLRHGLHTSPTLAALAYTSFSLGMMTVRMAGNRLLSRFHSRHVLPAFAVVATVGLGGALVVDDPIGLLIGFGCLGLGLGSIVPSMFSAAARLHGVDVGAAISAVAAVSYAGFLVGPPIIGQLSALLTLRGALILLPFLTALVAVLTATSAVFD
jgi:MFS family permease